MLLRNWRDASVGLLLRLETRVWGRGETDEEEEGQEKWERGAEGRGEGRGRAGRDV